MNTFPIIDAHCHFWDPARFHYAWNSGLITLNRPFQPADLVTARANAEVEKLIFIECDCSPAESAAEAAWVAHLAEAEPRLKGIVARAPLEKGAAVRTDLELLAKYPLVKGIRRNLQGEGEVEFGLRPEFIAGVRLLSEFGFTFDLCIRHEQLRSVVEIAHRAPQTVFILDHFGKPDVRRKKTDPWSADLKALAAHPNVFCKISGLTTEADWSSWQPDDLRFYFEHAAECFGFKRLLFGSDWPMATLATTYSRWVETVRELFSFASETELKQLFHDNAERVYRV